MDQKLIYGLVGGIVGAILVLLLTSYFVNNRNYGMMSMMGMRPGANYMMRADDFGMEDMMEGMMGHDQDSGMTMDEMVGSLITLRGDEFDRAFIKAMIEHHQGAIDMANLISTRSERQELKDLGNDILTAQTKEIEMMQGWLDSWY